MSIPVTISSDPLSNLNNAQNRPIFIPGARRVPTEADAYPPGSQWQYVVTSPPTIYKQVGLSTVIWTIEAETALDSLSDTANTVVTPSAPNVVPGNNIQLINLDGTIDIVSDAANHRIIFSANETGAFTQLNGNTGSMTPTSGIGTINGGTTGLTTTASASTMSLTGTLNVANGGTSKTSFTVYAPITGGTTTTGALQSADTGISNVGYVLTSTGPSSLPTWQATSPTGIQFIDGNSGTATGSTVIVSAASGQGTALFTASGDTNSITFTDGILDNTAIGESALSSIIDGTLDTCFGKNAGANIQGGDQNCFFGQNAGVCVVESGNNCAFGAYAMGLGSGDPQNCNAFGGGSLGSTISGDRNDGFGYQALGLLTSGTDNAGFGYQAGRGASGSLTGSYNCFFGSGSGQNLTTSDSSDINIGYNVSSASGVSNELRIGGGTGTGNGQQNKAFISGINGVTSSNALMVTIDSSTDQLGVATIPSFSTLTYTSVNNAASPYTVLTTDQYLACQTSTGTITIRLPNAPSTGRFFIIKDSNGASSTNNITVTTVGGAVNIDGATSYVIATNYQSLNVVFSGTAYEVY